MEHIVQFAVGIDDERIQNIMEQSAAKMISEEIMEVSHGVSWNGKVNDKPDKLKALFQEEVAKVVKENYDKIVDEAIKKATSHIMSSKKVREAINNVIEEKDV